MQALSLAQPLEAKPQTGHLSGIEAASIPVAPVAAASTSTASGQTAVTSNGMYTQDFYFYFLPLLMLKLSNMSLIKSNVSSVFYNDVMLCN